MTDNSSRISIKFTDEFEKQLYRLSKKYRNIRKDVEPIIEQLTKKIFIGDRIPGFSSDIYKARIKNSNLKKGKSAGYRLIYLVESETIILLLTIYSKSQQEDIQINQIKSIVDEFYRDD
jgi:mRNA-degrading endonuclease RelE of RelBE toxin-antitoxin system